ncbi:MAG: hypothetical protein ACRDA3_03820 [Peptostreptococcaceae bacterium]
MNKLESIQLYKDIQSIPSKYTDLQLKDNPKEIEDNLKLRSLLQFYKDKLDLIKERAHFVSKQTKDELVNKDSKDIYKALIDLNNFSLQKYNTLKKDKIESTPVKAVMYSTIDELTLINESIRNKEYTKDKSTYFYIYEKIAINAFMTFLALKDMDIDQNIINNLSQAVLSQIQTLAIISM